MLSRSVDGCEVSHTEVSQAAGTPASQLQQGGTALADLPQYVVIDEAAEVESEEAAEVAETLGDDVEIMFQQVVRVSYVVVFTRHRVVVQTGDVEMLQIFQLVETIQDCLVSVGEWAVGTLSSWQT